MRGAISYLIWTVTVSNALLLQSGKRSVTKELFVANGGPYGSWSTPEYCPAGTFASGFSMKVEADQFSGDDTALNAIRLKCTDTTGHAQVGYQVTSGEGPFGSWGSVEDCPNMNYLVGFALQVEGSQGSKDDTTANYIKFFCRNYDAASTWSELNHPPGKGIWGSFGASSDKCDAHSAICGLSTRIESVQGSGDDTALNDVKFYCCNDIVHGQVVG